MSSPSRLLSLSTLSPSFAMAMVFLLSTAISSGGCKSSPGGGAQDAKSVEGPRADRGRWDGVTEGHVSPTCPSGTDGDHDGYGVGCKAGPDCDDTLASVHPNAPERCDGIDNDCDTIIDEGCGAGGTDPFPLTAKEDPQVKESTGVALDGKGDLVLGSTKTTFNYMWIANSDDLDRGTISKIDTVTLKEVARYFSVTCHSNPTATGCVDLHGKPIVAKQTHDPSRTAVDTHFDVWVANRAFDHQPSVTKISNDLVRCVDRNKNKHIETSADRNGDGRITVDCDGDGQPDNAATVCKGVFAGKAPEFLGDDDECILFTVNYGKTSEIGRSVCLDAGGIEAGTSNAWVGTYARAMNRFYKVDGKTGALSGPYHLRAGHHSYGCVVDSQGILWSVDDDTGTLTYLDTQNPSKVGPLLDEPFGDYAFYGIAIDGKDNIWMGGWDSQQIFRYRPTRTSFATLHQGKWTAIAYPSKLAESRGIAADDRGKIWVAINNGYILRVDQGLSDGFHDLTKATSYWRVKGSEVVGVGVDFAGHIWAISNADDVASRLDVDKKGDPVTPPTGTTKTVRVGEGPYTYSDFTGFGLRTFTRRDGLYVYELACPGAQEGHFDAVEFKTTLPKGTSITLDVRKGQADGSFGAWSSPYTASPADIKAVAPTKATRLQVRFSLKTSDPDKTPTLHEFTVRYACGGIN